jgi:hypothetical protein
MHSRIFCEERNKYFANRAIYSDGNNHPEDGVAFVAHAASFAQPTVGLNVIGAAVYPSLRA